MHVCRVNEGSQRPERLSTTGVGERFTQTSLFHYSRNFVLRMLIRFQMRPDIKKYVFHLCWSPESVPADVVSLWVRFRSILQRHEL